MDAKEYLSQIRKLDIKINNKSKEIITLTATAMNITPTYSKDRVQNNKIADKTGDSAIKLAEARNEISEYIDELLAVKKEIIGVIDKVTDFKCYDVLHKRYIQYMKWENIAVEMNKTNRRELFCNGNMENTW